MKKKRKMRRVSAKPLTPRQKKQLSRLLLQARAAAYAKRGGRKSRD